LRVPARAAEHSEVKPATCSGLMKSATKARIRDEAGSLPCGQHDVTEMGRWPALDVTNMGRWARYGSGKAPFLCGAGLSGWRAAGFAWGQWLGVVGDGKWFGFDGRAEVRNLCRRL
jgi:hypothetical protein